MRFAFLPFVLSSFAVRAHAQTAPGEVIVVPPVDARSGTPEDLVSPDASHADRRKALEQHGFVTEVRLGERGGETAPLAEVLADTVGAHVRSLGGLGGFSSLSVRGAPTGHTAVLVDGVPLARLGSASADLGRFEPGAFSRIALHRGGAPGGAQASVLELMTEVGPAPRGRPLRLSAGAGSFGARHLRGRFVDGDEERGTGLHAALGYTAADGDFLYFDDNGTPLNRADDETTRRSNNGFEQVDATARGALAPGAWDLRGGARWSWKRQGVPGGATLQSERTSLTTWSQILDAAAARPRAFGQPRVTARTRGFLLLELQRYRDPDGEIGLSAQDRRYLTSGGGAAAGLDVDAGAVGRVATDLEWSAEHFSATDLGRDDGEEPRTSGHRWELAGAVADRVAFGRFEVVPALRVELHRTRPAVDPSAAEPAAMDRSIRTDVYVTPRVSALAHLADAVALKAGAGRFVRAPTALELYGDRGFIVGNPALRAETGVGGDLGVVVAPVVAGPVDRVYAEAAAFTTRSRDTIVLVPTAALVAGAQNLGTAVIWGGELVASARAARALTATAHYTLLRTRQGDTLPSYEGKELPQRPRHQLYGRVDLAGRAWQRLGVLFADASITSGNHLDPANLSPVPRRTLLGVGAKVELWPGLLAAIDGKNLTDQRVEQVPLDPPPSPDLTSAPRAVSDFFGYPLPGRAFYVTLQWEH